MTVAISVHQRQLNNFANAGSQTFWPVYYHAFGQGSLGLLQLAGVESSRYHVVALVKRISIHSSHRPASNADLEEKVTKVTIS